MVSDTRRLTCEVVCRYVIDKSACVVNKESKARENLGLHNRTCSPNVKLDFPTPPVQCRKWRHIDYCSGCARPAPAVHSQIGAPIQIDPAVFCLTSLGL